jgi:Ribosomal protein S9/S16
MFHVKRISSTSPILHHILSPIKPRHPTPCIRFVSRWNPSHPRPRTKPPKPIIPALTQDPKDLLPGWLEFKEDLLSRCQTPDEIQSVNELTLEEATLLLDNGEKGKRDVPIVRTMPANRNYFSGQPVIEQRLQDIEKHYEKYSSLPKAPPHLVPEREWRNAAIASDLDATAGAFNTTSIRGKFKRNVTVLVKELNKIHPVLMPTELKEWLDRFVPLRKSGERGTRQIRRIDKYGRSKGNGKRKTARAKAQIVPGHGQVYVNGKLASDFFTRVKDVENVLWPLQVLNVLGQYNVWIATFGGGTTGIFLFFRG